MAHVQVQFAWGATAEIAALTTVNREVLVDTTTYSLVIMDGVTAGGWRQASQAWVTQQLAGQTNSVAANSYLHARCK